MGVQRTNYLFGGRGVGSAEGPVERPGPTPRPPATTTDGEAGMLLTAADLRHGRVCEACHQSFRLGDPAFPTLTGVTADGTPVEGDWRCADCWTRDRPCRP